jgi:hypothetical protein
MPRDCACLTPAPWHQSCASRPTGEARYCRRLLRDPPKGGNAPIMFCRLTARLIAAGTLALTAIWCFLLVRAALWLMGRQRLRRPWRYVALCPDTLAGVPRRPSGAWPRLRSALVSSWFPGSQPPMGKSKPHMPARPDQRRSACPIADKEEGLSATKTRAAISATFGALTGAARKRPCPSA